MNAHECLEEEAIGEGFGVIAFPPHSHRLFECPPESCFPVLWLPTSAPQWDRPFQEPGERH
jgi:hypothetical protein